VNFGGQIVNWPLVIAHSWSQVDE